MGAKTLARVGNVVLVEFTGDGLGTRLYLDVDPPSPQQRAEGWRDGLAQDQATVLAGAIVAWTETVERRKI